VRGGGLYCTVLEERRDPSLPNSWPVQLSPGPCLGLQRCFWHMWTGPRGEFPGFPQMYASIVQSGQWRGGVADAADMSDVCPLDIWKTGWRGTRRSHVGSVSSQLLQCVRKATIYSR